MKKTLFLLFYIISSNLYSQTPIRLFYDSFLEVCNEKEAIFIREAHFDTINYSFNGQFTDYTMRGVKILNGNYKNGIKDGDFIFYDQDGNIYANGIFSNNHLKGKWNYYYPNGQIKCIIEFEPSDFKLFSYFTSLGENILPNGTGEFKFNFINIFESETEQYLTGTLTDSLRIKKWKIFDGNKVIASETYKKNKFKSAQYYLNNFSSQKIRYKRFVTYYGFNNLFINNSEKPLNNEFFIPYRLYKMEILQMKENVSLDDYPFIKYLPQWENINAVGFVNDSTTVNLDKMPQYLGGMNKIQKYIATNIRYPRAAMEKKITGKLYIEVIIDETGSIYSVKPAKGANEILEKEAVRVLSGLADFKPGFYKNKRIKTKLIFPVTFNRKTF